MITAKRCRTLTETARIRLRRKNRKLYFELLEKIEERAEKGHSYFECWNFTTPWESKYKYVIKLFKQRLNKRGFYVGTCNKYISW